MIRFINAVLANYDLFILMYFITLNFFYFYLTFLAAERLISSKIRNRVRITQERDFALIPDVAIIVPAHNEEPTINDSVRSFLKVDYPKLNVFVVNDGSEDNTLEVLKKRFNLFEVPIAHGGEIETKPVRAIYKSTLDRRLTVIDKENGGKSDALNAGLNHSSDRLFCCMDADTIIERDSIYKLVRPYLERDSNTIAIGGVIRVANGCRVEKGEIREARLPKSYIVTMQVIEYIRSFLCGRVGWSRLLNSILIISGAFGLFDRKTVVEAGGYRNDCVGEDMELVVRLHKMMCEKKRAYKMFFLPDPVCWTQVPDNLTDLASQRNRWQRGLIQTLMLHWNMIGNPKYGMAGIVGMPFHVIFELMSPVIELSGYVLTAVSFIFGWLDFEFVFLFFALAILLNIMISLFSFLLEEFTVKKFDRPADIAWLFLCAIIENVGYRQLNLFFRLTATFNFFYKGNNWGNMKRATFAESVVADPLAKLVNSPLKVVAQKDFPAPAGEDEINLPRFCASAKPLNGPQKCGPSGAPRIGLER